MILGIDLDGVLGDLHAVVIEHVWQQRGLRVCMSDINCWNAEVAPGLLWSPLVYEVLESDVLLAQVPAIAGAAAYMQLLAYELEAVGDSIAVVTTRPERSAPATRRWVADHIGPYPVVITEHKPDACDVLLDDYDGNIRAMLAAGKQAILFEKPWNVAFQHPHRVSEWKQVPEALRRLEWA